MKRRIYRTKKNYTVAVYEPPQYLNLHPGEVWRIGHTPPPGSGWFFGSVNYDSADAAQADLDRRAQRYGWEEV